MLAKGCLYETLKVIKGRIMISNTISDQYVRSSYHHNETLPIRGSIRGGVHRKTKIYAEYPHYRPNALHTIHGVKVLRYEYRQNR